MLLGAARGRKTPPRPERKFSIAPESMSPPAQFYLHMKLPELAIDP
jgi:hypothetical protein